MSTRKLQALALLAAFAGLATWFLLREPTPSVPDALLPSKHPEGAYEVNPEAHSEPADLAPPGEAATQTPALPLPEAFASLEAAWKAQIDPELRERLKLEAWLERPGLISARLRFDGLRMEPASLKWAQSENGAWALADASLPSLPKARTPEFPRYDAEDGRRVVVDLLEDIGCTDAQVSFSEAYWEAEHLKDWIPSLLYRVDARCPGGAGALRERWTLRADDLSVARKRPAARPLFGP